MAPLRRSLFYVPFGLLAAFAVAAAPSQTNTQAVVSRPRWTPPLAFERNEGQMPAEIGFLGRTKQYTVAVSGQSLRFLLPGSRGTMPVELSFSGGHADAPVGVTEAGFRTNSYLGADTAKYRSGVRNYTRIGLRHVYSGVDVEFYATDERLEHDFRVQPDADAGAIAMTLRSGHAAKLGTAGEVSVAAEEGELRLERPVAYQLTVDGRRTEVASEFVLGGWTDGEQELRFRLGKYDHTRELVIDPVIVYATFAAGNAGSTGTAIATDPAGNVYLAGTTTSAAFNSTPAPTVNCGISPCGSDVFITELAAGSNGAAPQWITYIGAVSGGSTANVAAMVANASTVYLGGSTNDTGLAAGPAASAPNATGGYVGYISSLVASTGALNTTALLYLDATATNSAVRALALDGANNLYAAGALGSTTAPAPQLLMPSPHALAVAPATTMYAASTQPQPGNAFVAEFAAGGALSAPTTYLATPSFFTFVQTNTQINGIGVDGTGAIYVGGQTTGNFSLTEGAGPATNVNSMNDAFELTFTPQSGAAPTVNAFTWIDGTGSDTVAGLALAGGGTSYLFGNTTSTNLPSTGGVVQGAAVDPVANGFVALAGSTGTSGVAPVALTYLGGSGTVDTVTGGAFANGNVYVTGQTNAPAATTTSPAATAFAGVATAVASATAPFNPQALAYGMDATGGLATRGYLASLAGNLATVNYVANIGGASGSDVATGVALDTNHNAYVAGTLGYSSTPYTSFQAYQTVSPSTANPSAYVAEVAYAQAGTGLALAVVTGSPSASPIGYAGVGNASNVTYTWTLTAPTATGAANLVVRVPAVAQLTYTSASITDPGTANAPIACPVSPGGAYCILPTVPQTGGANDTLNVVLQATVPASAASMYGAFNVAATASSPASEYATSSQANTISAPAVLTITPAATFAPTTVFSTNTGASGPQTQATYAFTIANSGTGASEATQFTLTPPANLQVVAPVSVTATGVVGTPTCDTSSAATGCSAINLPAGASLVYSLTGTYLDAAVGASGSSAAAPNFSATASGFLSTVNASIAPNTTIRRGVHLHVVGTVSAPPTGQTNFNLNDSLTYTINVSNAGPSASSGTDPLTVTLPTGFVASAGSGGTALSCAAPYTTCTVPVPVLAAGGNMTFTVTGTFPDTALNQGVGATPQSRIFSAVVMLPLVNSYDSGGATGDYSSTSPAILLQRTAVLTIVRSLAPQATVCAGGGAACVYMANTADLGDKVGYNFVVQNAGPNVAVNAAVTIALPFVPANPAGTMHPLAPGSPVEIIGAPPFGSALTCNYLAGPNQIVCNNGNLPVAASALGVSGNATFGAGPTPATDAVPATTAFVTTAGAPGSITATEDANGAPSPVSLPVVEVDRAAHLVTAKQVGPTGSTPTLPINLDENAPILAAGVNDTLTVTIQVGNTPLNNAPNVVVTETLPAFFRLTQPPPAFCTTGSPAAPLLANTRTGASSTPVVMSCALGTVTAGTATASTGGTASVGAGAISFSYTGKFEDNGVNADITGTPSAKMKQVAALVPTASSATPDAVDPVGPSDKASGTQTIGVIRAAHLVLRKTRNAAVAATPATFADRTDPNLDEKTAATTFGLNDEVEYDIAIGNAGVNTALGVQFTDTLPPYFTLLKTYLVPGASTQPDAGPNATPGSPMPAANLVCYAGAATGTPLVLPYATGASTAQITCAYGTPASNPQSLASGLSRSGAPDPATAIEFIYQGKFQDNAPADDNILLGTSTATVNSMTGDATGSFMLAVDGGPPSDGRSLPVPAYVIQRAAHLTVVGGSPFQVKPDDTPLTAGGLNGTGIVAEAEPSSVSAPTPVFNCLRYKALIQNTGPNIARQPQLTLAPPPGMNLSSVASAATTTAANDGPLASSCAYVATVGPTVSGTTAIPVSERAGNTLVLDVDGYFGLNTLTGQVPQNGFAMRYTALTDPGIKDSGTGPAFAATTGSDVTVVNTPFGANFYVTPIQPVRIEFHAVATPGTTTASIALARPAMPTGVSPDPRLGQTASALYQPGTAPNFYALSTTAAPTAGSTTGLCLTSGTAGAPLTDIFSKPERVLLWALDGLPGGSPLNQVPHVTTPYAGDITLSVANAAGGSYVEAGGPAMPYTQETPLPARQTQPSRVCGQVNVFAPAAAPMTVAVLEPVNYAPLITANAQQPTQAPGKGVSEVSFEFPTTVHDYNDNDPCYVGGVGNRARCDDNLVLTTWIFGGENLVPAVNHAFGPLAPDSAQSFLEMPSPSAPSALVPRGYEVQAGATLFLEVADQVGELSFNAAGDCDPGRASGYTPVNPCAADSTALTGTPPQKTIFGGAELAVLTPSLNGGSSALIALPPAADPTSATTGLQTGYTIATATITAGQTVGFQWPLGNLIPTAGGNYTLSCFMVDSATLASKIPFPAGISCQIPAGIVYPAGHTSGSVADPSIYVATSGTVNARNATSGAGWRSAMGGVVAALLLPLLIFRRRSGVGAGVLWMVLLLGGVVSLSGCGAGFNQTAPSTATAAATYSFRASATPAGGGSTLTTAAFQVKVVAGN